MEKKKLSIGLISLVGLITTIELAIVYYNANFNDSFFHSFCYVNSFIDCDGIAQTTHSQFFGIPLAYWGMFLYLFIIFMLFVNKLKNFRLLKFLEVFKNPYSYIAALGIISFTISMILLCVSLFEIKKLCVLCAFTYILNLAISLIAMEGIGFKQAIKDSINDLFDGLRIKPYAIAFLIVMLCATGFLIYTDETMAFAPQVKRVREYAPYMNAKKNKYAVSGNVLGKVNSKHVIHTYTDYECPICRVYDIMIHRLAKENDVLIIHHNYPLDTECNKYLTAEFHHGSCMKARYAVAAENQGKLWDMNNLLFEKKPQSEEEVIKIAESLNLDIERLKEDAYSLETMRKIQADIDNAQKQGILGTPTSVVNGKINVGIKPMKEMKAWLNDEK